MTYKIAVLVSDWNFEVVNQYFDGIGKFSEEHRNFIIHIFDDFGIYGSAGEGSGSAGGGMEIFNLPDMGSYDGIMIEGDQGWPSAVRQKIMDAAAKRHVPVASLNYPLEGSTYVGINNYEALRMLTEHVIRVHGARRPAFVKGYEKSIEAVDRRRAFEHVCREQGIPRENVREYGGTWVMESGTKAAEKMLEERQNGIPLPDAVLCCNDQLAVGVSRVLQKNGVRIPEDVMVTGFDNLDMARFYTPRISTIARNYAEIARSGMLYLCDVIEKKAPFRRVIYSPFKMILTGSCGCPDIPVDIREVESSHLSMSLYLRMLYSLQNTMEKGMTRSRSVREIMDVFEKNAGVFGCRGMYLVMNPNYMNCYSQKTDPKKYAEDMKLMAVYEEDRPPLPMDPETHVYRQFPKKDLLPDGLDKDSRLMVFYPLHHESFNIGYVALKGISPASRFNILEVMLMLTANAVESVFSYAYIKDVNNKLEGASERDPLTGLYNRFGFDKTGRIFCEERLKAGKGVHFFFVDMDDMKYINDTFGHYTGDLALKIVADSVRTVADRYHGFCMRYGGDEFLIVTEDISIEMEKEIMEEIRLRIAKENFPSTLSVSVGEFRTEDYEPVSVNACISHADDRMYYRKNMKKSSGVIGREYDEVDDLTGLLTMRGFRRQADEVIGRIAELGRSYSIAYFNIGNFKTFNNAYGFEEGDRLLKKMAEIIRENFPGRLTARFGSDRFAVIAFDFELDQNLQKAVDQMREEEKHMVSIKVGLCQFDPGETDCISACDKAKVACDSIRKDYGRDIRAFDEELAEETRMQNYFITHLDDSVREGCIEVYFQTITDCRTKMPCASEALARWKSPSYGLLPPVSFIRVLEEYHVIYKLDLEILRQICAQIQEVGRAGVPEVPISCNLSRFDFADCNMFEEVEKIMDEYDIPRHKVHIEVTESSIVTDPGFMKKQLRKFHNAGYEIWMDDFGSGYSSFNVLKDFDFDVIKLDMELLRNMNSKSKEIVVSIINLAKALHMRTLAEGVETEEQFAFIRDAGCDMAQGFYFSRPHPFDMDEWKKNSAGAEHETE